MKKRKLWRVMTACILKRHGIYKKKKHWLISLLVGTSKVSTLLLTPLILPPVSGSSEKRKVIWAACAWISTEKQPEILNFILTH